MTRFMCKSEERKRELRIRVRVIVVAAAFVRALAMDSTGVGGVRPERVKIQRVEFDKIFNEYSSTGEGAVLVDPVRKLARIEGSTMRYTPAPTSGSSQVASG